MSLFKDSAASADGRKAETQVLELVSKFHQSFFLHRHKNLLTINSCFFFNQINNFPHLKIMVKNNADVTQEHLQRVKH